MNYDLNINTLQRPCNNVQGRLIAALNNSKIPKKQNRGFGVITVAMAMILFAGLLKFWALAVTREIDAARAQALFNVYQSYALTVRLTGEPVDMADPNNHLADLPTGVTLNYVDNSEDSTNDEVVFDFTALPQPQRLILRGKLQRWLSVPNISDAQAIFVEAIPTNRPNLIVRKDGGEIFTDLKFNEGFTIINLKDIKVNSVSNTTLNADAVILEVDSDLIVAEPFVISAPFSADLFTVPSLPPVQAVQIGRTQINKQLVTRDLTVEISTIIRTDLTANKLEAIGDSCDEECLTVTHDFTVLKSAEMLTNLQLSATIRNWKAKGLRVQGEIMNEGLTTVTGDCVGC